ncbi:enterobactin exporter entS [Magnetospirillum fulvum MGU-K5]|uniref:Enterobactin exporter entS n=1 Tax=Magnetospirillum fulvum MGU-K5 TaxID=1316936 RepID=S9SE81_MAGFU|nr:enterobactin exporter entS [Magnetospirillum fulvum MGU-K5]
MGRARIDPRSLRPALSSGRAGLTEGVASPDDAHLTETSLLDLLTGNRNVRAFAGIRACLALAGQMQTVAIGWYVYALTGSAWHLGFIGLVQFLPGAVLFPLIGYVADHYDRRRVVAATLWVQALASLALIAAVAQPDPSLWALYLIIVVIGAAKAFTMPALSSLLPNLVDAETFPRAVATGSSAFQVATIIGPAVGGLLYAINHLVTFGLAAVIYLGAILLVLGVTVRGDATPARPGKGEDDGVLAGLRYIRTNPVLLGAISLDMFAVLLGGVTALLPIYASDILKVGPVGLGLLRSRPGDRRDRRRPVSRPAQYRAAGGRADAGLRRRVRRRDNRLLALDVAVAVGGGTDRAGRL